MTTPIRFKIEKPKSQSEFKIPPAGTHPARCISVIDLGTQEIEWQGSIKYQRKIHITWELPLEKAVFNEEKGEQPFVVSRSYTLTMDERGALRQDLERWRGKKFTDSEAEWFDPSSILGKACTLTLVHSPNQDGTKTYANIASISGMMKGVEYPSQINPSVVYTTENGEDETFLNLPEWIQEKIKKSPEFKHALGTEAVEEEEADQIPF